MKKVATWILILAAFVPLVMSHTLVPAVGGKVLLYRAVGFLSILFLFLACLHHKNRDQISDRIKRVFRHPITLAATAGFVLVSVSTLFAFDRYVAFFGEPIRGEGFLTLAALYAIFIVMAAVFRRQDWKRFFVATVLCGIVMFVWQIVQRLGGIDRPSAGLGNPIFLAGYYLFVFVSGWILAFACMMGGRGVRILGWIAIGIGLAGIFITETRGTILGIGSGVSLASIVAVWMGNKARIGRVSVRTAGWIILAAIIAVGAVFAATYRQPMWQHVPGINRVADRNTTTLDSRVKYLGIVGTGFVQEPLLRKTVGWGWDNFLFFSNRYYDPAVYSLDPTGINRAHNKLADMLIMTGVLGLCAYLAVWVRAIKDLRNILRKDILVGIGLVLGFAAYFVHNLFAFDVPVTLFYFYAFLAFLITYEEIT